MTRLADLQEQVASTYELLELPSWPDPHPGTTAPTKDEYSRVTDPDRYRIVSARAHAWVQTLGALPGVEQTSMPPALLDKTGHLSRFDRGVRLTPGTPGTLPLLLLERDVPDVVGTASMTVLHVSVVRPEVGLQLLPDCGCDACDRGSDDLLEAVDDTISHVVGGPSVVLRGSGWHADWYPGGGSSGGEGRGPDHPRTMDWCRRLAAGQAVRLPRGSEAFVGQSWFA